MSNIPPPAYSPNNNNNNNNSNSNINVDRLRLNLSTEQIFNAANDSLNASNAQIRSSTMMPMPTKSGWRSQNSNTTAINTTSNNNNSNNNNNVNGNEDDEEEEAIPNDSLYANQDAKKNGSMSWREKQFGSRPSLNGLAHWSSHGYLAKANDGTGPSRVDTENQAGNGYVVLRRDPPSRQPQSLPTQVQQHQQDGDRKYFSVKGFTDMNTKHNQETETTAKYLSVDSRYNSMKNLPPDIRMKLRENLRQVQEQQQQQQQQRNFSPYQAPPPPPSYPYPPAPPPRPAGMKPAPPPRQESIGQHTTSSTTTTTAVPTTTTTAAATASGASKSSSNLESSKQMSNSVSWLEWTQQLQAYIAWVNSQLRKRTDLRPVQDLRTDLQSGEVLAQLIEIICKLLLTILWSYDCKRMYVFLPNIEFPGHRG